MAATTLFNGPFIQITAKQNGQIVPVVGAQIFVYIAGTSTPQDVFTDPGLSVAWDQPIETNLYGQTDGPVYVTPTPALKIVVLDEDDVPVPGYPVDDWSPAAVGS
jgi:hypothetical protein